MSTSLRVLILEDRPADVELMLHELRRAGFEPDWQRVETEADYLAHLGADFDVILSDYFMPQFDAPRALHLLQERGLDIPFIIVTGSISEEVAVESIKQNVADYLLKDRLARLGPAVTRALEQKRLRDERRRTEERLRLQSAALEAAANGIVITDRAGTTLWVNLAFTRLTSYTAEEVIGQNPRLLKSGQHDAAFYQELWETILSGQVWHGEIINRRKDGSLYTEEMTITPVQDERGEITNFIAIKQDVTERKLAEEKLRYLSTHDVLTDLYNRAFFEAELARHERGRQFPVSVVMADVDDLKAINDGLGHATGDELLRQAAQLFKSVLRAERWWRGSAVTNSRHCFPRPMPPRWRLSWNG